MRISTNQIFDAGSSSILSSQSNLYKLQNQLSSGRRVQTPQDDPVAASQALIVTQSREVNAQYIDNQGAAKSQLGLVDSQLASLVNVLQNIRTTVVAAGNTGTTSQRDRETMATDIESRLSEIMGIANSDNGIGEFLFSGYKGNVKPFAVNAAEDAIPPATTAPVSYYGDDGERLLQVSASRQIGISVAGSDVFMAGKTGNGTFVASSGGNFNVGIAAGVLDPMSTATADAGTVINRALFTSALENALAGRPISITFEDNAGTLSYRISDPLGGTVPVPADPPVAYTSGAAIPLVTADGVDFGARVAISGVPVVGDTFLINPTQSNNTGTATIDAGSVLDPQKWSQAVNNAAAGQPVEIRFASVGGVMSYGIYDPVGGLSAMKQYTAGQVIPLVTAGGVDFGSQVVVQGRPAAGDSFEINPSTNQSVFQTVQNLIGILRNPISASTYTNTQFSNELGAELSNIDQSLDNISRVQSIVGTRMQEIESLGNLSSDLDIQYQSTLSDLQDIDYAKAISDFMKQQMNLEAAQSSFAKITGLSLFNYL